MSENNNQLQKKDSVFSELQMQHIVFDKLQFERSGFRSEQNTEIQMTVQTAINKEDEGKYRVSLHVAVVSEGEYTADVWVSGFCEISEDCEIKEDLLKTNAVAILFPYVRSELTLLTAQPETTPIVLPTLNINALLNQLNDN